MLPITIIVTCVLTRKNRVDTIVSGDSRKSTCVKSKVPSLVLRVAAFVRFTLEFILSMFVLIPAYCYISERFWQKF